MTSLFKETFVADGVANVFFFTGQDENGDALSLNLETVEITIDGNVLVEGVDFSVDRPNASFDLSGGSSPYSPPIVANETTIYAQAGRDFNVDPTIIEKMKYWHIFGGDNDTRVFLAGNPDIPNQDYRSDLTEDGIPDATYFPVDNVDIVGDKSDPILGYSTQYGSQVVHKEREIWVGDLDIDVTTNIYAFRRRPITDNVLFVAPDSIAVIENKPMFVTKKGAYQYVGATGVRDERNVEHKSDRIDKNVDPIGRDGLLQLANLEACVAVDFQEKYIIYNSVNEVAWVYDYRYLSSDESGELVGEWFVWTECPYDRAAVVNEIMYTGDNSLGVVYKYGDEINDTRNSTEQAIDSYIDTKLHTFDTYSELKLIDKVFYSMKAAIRTSADMYIRTDINGNSWQYIDTNANSIYTYGSQFTYGDPFTYGGNIFPDTKRDKIRLKKANFLQVRLRNDKLDETMGILSMVYKFLYQREVK